MAAPPRTQAARSGLTLVELLVILGIIALLISLFAPAILAAREGVRRAACANNLRQLGLAIRGYESAHGLLPDGRSYGGYSLHVAILPYLEQAPLANGLNLWESAGGNPSQYGVEGFSPPFLLNRTAARTDVGTFLCPADSMPERAFPRFHSYAGNGGLSGRFEFNGIFQSQPVALSEVTDGTSNTIALAEWLVGLARRSADDPARLIFDTPLPAFRSLTYPQFLEACRTADTSEPNIGGWNKGQNWLLGELGRTLYTHMLRPNNLSCYYGLGNARRAAWSIGSLHAGGANAAFVDGHVAFLPERMAEPVFWALGSRDGNEPIPSEY